MLSHFYTFQIILVKRKKKKEKQNYFLTQKVMKSRERTGVSLLQSYDALTNRQGADRRFRQGWGFGEGVAADEREGGVQQS